MNKIILGLLALVGIHTAFAENVEPVSPQQALMMQTEQQAIIVDVRESDEWKAGHIAGAIHIPLSEIQNRVTELTPYQNRPIITQCRSGVRSAKAADLLKMAGFVKVYNLDGGINAWNKAALKTTSAN